MNESLTQHNKFYFFALLQLSARDSPTAINQLAILTGDLRSGASAHLLQLNQVEIKLWYFQKNATSPQNTLVAGNNEIDLGIETLSLITDPASHKQPDAIILTSSLNTTCPINSTHSLKCSLHSSMDTKETILNHLYQMTPTAP